MDDTRPAREGVAGAMLTTAALIGLRLAAGAFLPLSSDEAYYWLWSKHLTAGYLDHPPAIAWLIRAGTALFGDTAFGVRFWPIMASAGASWFVWRAAAELLSSERAGAHAAVLFNLTLMVAVEMLAATPDAPALLGAAGLLFALVRVAGTGDGRWWIAAGIAGGIALLSKFTALFLAAGTFAWIVVEPSRRRWLASPWPYLGLLIAILLDLPNLIWNGQHGWETYAFQFARVSQGHFTLRYLGEFIGSQIVFASPFVFLLGVMALSRRRGDEALRLIALTMAPAIAYFLAHALHDRVQANWPSFLMPAFVVGAVAASRLVWPVWMTGATKLFGRAAAPVAAIMLVLAYGQALFAIVPMGRADPFARLLGFGIDALGHQVDQARTRIGARAVLVSDYATAGWLGFYLPSHSSVVVIGEPERWDFAASADPRSFSGPLLYAVEDRHDRRAQVAANAKDLAPVGTISRARRGVVIARYRLYRVEGLDGSLPMHKLP